MLEPYSDSVEQEDIRYFAAVPLDVLKKLIADGYVDMEPWNECPGVEKLFLPFLESHPGFRAHGYVHYQTPLEQSIVIEGVHKLDSLSLPDVMAFANTFHGADGFYVYPRQAYCWYD